MKIPKAFETTFSEKSLWALTRAVLITALPYFLWMLVRGPFEEMQYMSFPRYVRGVIVTMFSEGLFFVCVMILPTLFFLHLKDKISFTAFKNAAIQTTFVVALLMGLMVYGLFARFHMAILFFGFFATAAVLVLTLYHWFYFEQDGREQHQKAWTTKVFIGWNIFLACVLVMVPIFELSEPQRF